MSRVKKDIPIEEVTLDLLRHQLAFQYYLAGVTKETIASKLHIRKATVTEMLKGIERKGQV